MDLVKYVDDLVLASAADANGSESENHLTAIEGFFSRLETANLKINLSKCTFFQREIKFLGQIITSKGRRVDDAYVRRLLTFRHPKSPSELRAYLGALEWISHHIYGMKEYLAPLRPLLKGARTKKHMCIPFKEWTATHQDAFTKLQILVKTHMELLHHPDFDKKFYLFTDASNQFYFYCCSHFSDPLDNLIPVVQDVLPDPH